MSFSNTVRYRPLTRFEFSGRGVAGTQTSLLQFSSSWWHQCTISRKLSRSLVTLSQETGGGIVDFFVSRSLKQNTTYDWINRRDLSMDLGGKQFTKNLGSRNNSSLRPSILILNHRVVVPQPAPLTAVINTINSLANILITINKILILLMNYSHKQLC